MCGSLHSFSFAAVQQQIESASPDADAVEGSVFVQHYAINSARWLISPLKC